MNTLSMCANGWENVLAERAMKLVCYANICVEWMRFDGIIRFLMEFCLAFEKSIPSAIRQMISCETAME